MRKRLVAGSLFVAAAVLTLASAASVRAADAPAETPQQKDARMHWWRDAKFGLFIHWGVYSVPAGTYRGQRVPGIGEWIMRNAKIPVAEYRGFAREFNPVKYDPGAWADLAREAGMKYIVITSKHHDGFANFDTKVSDWNIRDATPYHKEVIGALAQAARKRGLKFGCYYSQSQDWTNPGGAKAGFKEGDGWDPAHKGSYDEYLRKIAVPQVREVLTQIQPDILWWDTPVDMTPERAKPLHDLLALRPGIITNNRLGGGFAGDTDTPEQYIPATGIPGRDWEVCMTMNDTWGYKSYDQNWKSPEDLIRKLVDIVSKGGNFLLNVGPTPEGEIPPPSIERLKTVGRWMKVNGESIYGTTASPFTRLTWGRCTKKVGADRTTLYLHVFDWPADGRLAVPGLRSRIVSAKLLAGGKVSAESAADGAVLHLPGKAPDPYASVIRVEIANPLEVTRVLPRQSADGSITLGAMEADIHNQLGTDAKVETRTGGPNIGYWTDPRATVSWHFRVDRPGTFEVVADVAAEGASHLQLVSGTTKQPVETPATGGYDSYRKVTLGRVTFAQAGEQELLLQPIRSGWQPINVRSLVLKPATP